jgi:hypothetical protein
MDVKQLLSNHGDAMPGLTASLNIQKNFGALSKASEREKAADGR